MEQRRTRFSPKIISLIRLHEEHALAVEARLLEFGIKWSHVGGENPHDWGDVAAVVYTEPPWGPINRSILGDKWLWSLPGYDELVTLVELIATGNVQRGNQSGAKRSDFPKRVQRPGDEREVVDQTTLGNRAVDLSVMADMMKGRLSGDVEANENLFDIATLI